MKVIVCKDYQEVSEKSAEIVAQVMKDKPNAVLGLATGSTPEGMYAKLVEMNRKGEIDFSDITTVNLDEYFPISPDNDQSYRYFMNKNLFDRVNIDKSRTNVPNGIDANARFFASADEVPTHALTMGMGTILSAKKIIILANGKGKHNAVMKMLKGTVTTMCPASFLNLHDDVTLVVDEECYNG